MGKKSNFYRNNYQFLDSAMLNDMTYIDYLERLKKVALSMFEWVNLPNSMDSRYLELCLYHYGQASLLKDRLYGFINTKASSAGKINIYGLPTELNCYSYEYQTTRRVYNGLPYDNEEIRKENETSGCILVQNTFERYPTEQSLELFAWRLYNAERTCDVNINAMRTPVIIICDDKQRHTITQILNQYNGNEIQIVGDKNQIGENFIKAVKTDAPIVFDKVMEHKKQIWNEALTFLGINNIIEEKKERLVADEVNSNNELINLNLQSFLAPRQLACKQFNDKFGFTGTDKEISVRVRSDLHNIIKNTESIIQDYNKIEDIKEISSLKQNYLELYKGGENNG